VNGLPSYHGTHANVEYSVTARLDVPWWPDAVAQMPISCSSRAERADVLRPVRFRSGGGGPEIYVELDGTSSSPRAHRLPNHDLRVGDRRCGGCTSSSSVGSGPGPERDGDDDVDDFRLDIRWRRSGSGAFAFEIPDPGGGPIQLPRDYSYLQLLLQIGLDIAWATDLVAETPLVIVR